jgi:hypothetical protein
MQIMRIWQFHSTRRRRTTERYFVMILLSVYTIMSELQNFKNIHQKKKKKEIKKGN